MRVVGNREDPNLAILLPVAAALEELCDSLVFVGGCTTGLLITTERARVVRATKDVDVIAQVASIANYHQIEKQFVSKGFQHDVSEDAPICRWVKEGLLIDLMPSEKGILGFHNRWYPLALKTAERVSLPNGTEINLISAPVFVATKLEAFKDRGNSDFLASHDLEDIISVIDGRDELLKEMEESDKDLRGYIAGQFKLLFSVPDFEYALSGHLPGDTASQARLPDLLSKLKLLAGVG